MPFFTCLINLHKQKNHKDRTSVVLLIALVFAAILILPILFSLKCDGTLSDNAPWTAIWTPMWLVDLFFLVSAVYFMFDKPEPPVTEEGDKAPPPEEEVPFAVKLSNLVTTVLFALIQIFVMMRMDRDIHWSWFKVFIPWFLYEGVHVVSLLQLALFTTVAPPDFENLTLIVEEGHSGEEEIFMQKIALESKYFEALLEQKNAQKTILVCLLRAWLAVFLALKLNGNDWNWGLVLLPVWVYLFAQYVYSYVLRAWGLSKLSGLNVEGIMAGAETDPMAVARLQQGNELLSSSFFGCLFQAVPLFMALMLVCRLQVSSYSTFLIILPVFLSIGCCCCAVFCTICCLSVVDMDGLNDEMEKQRQQQEGAGGGEKEYTPPNPLDVEAGVQHTANPSAEYGTFAPAVVVSPDESQSPIQQSAAPEPTVELRAVTNIDADID